MKKLLRKEPVAMLSCEWLQGGENIENYKRRRMLSPLASLDDETRAFFEKMVSVRKLKDFIFLRRENSRGR